MLTVPEDLIGRPAPSSMVLPQRVIIDYTSRKDQPPCRCSAISSLQTTPACHLWVFFPRHDPWWSEIGYSTT